MARPRSGPAAHNATGSVRVIGGRWRGSKLPVPDVDGLRPTSDRVRETVFNWLQPKLAGARVLDLFAGSGALGIEALSRGAREAVLVERDPALADALRAAGERLHAGPDLQVVRADALAWLRAPLYGRFDIVFLDPPFAAGLWQPVLQALPPWLAPDAWLYLEAPLAQPVHPGERWRLRRQGTTRDVGYALYEHAADEIALNGA